MDTLLLHFFNAQARIPALGYFIELSVKSSLVILLAGFAAFLLKNHSAAHRHLIWTLCMLTLCCLPVFTGLVPRLTVEIAGIPAYQPDTANIIDTSVTPLRWALVCYLSVLATLLAYLLIGLGRLYWITSRVNLPISAAGQAIVEHELQEQLSDVPVSVQVVTNVQGPLSWGLFKPVILLPRYYSNWSHSKLQHVLLHELKHISRLDWINQLAARYTRAVFWYNPLIWLACREHAKLAELACDDAVIQQTSRDADYAADLLDVARETQSKPVPDNLAMALANSFLGNRIMAILDSKRYRTAGSSEVIITSMIGAILLAAMFASITIRPQRTLPDTDDTRGPITLTLLPASKPVQPDTLSVHQIPKPPALEFSSNYPELDTVLTSRPADAVPSVNYRPAIRSVISVGELPKTLSEIDNRRSATVLFKRFPDYPALARQLGIQGYATVQYDINAGGKVLNAIIISAEPDVIFDAVVLEAIRQYRYDPPTLNGQPVGLNGLRTRFVFALDTDPG